MSDQPTPSSSTESTSTTRRRPGQAPAESSGGGSKIVYAILALIIALLGYALYQSKNGSESQATATAQAMGTLSNQVAELRTKLALSQSNLDLAQSNHHVVLNRRTAELINSSNRLIQTSLLLDHARDEARSAHSDVATRSGSLALAEAQRDEWQRQAAEVAVAQREAAQLKERLQQSTFALAALQEKFGRVNAEKADLERRLEDPVYLKLQARHAEEAADLRRRNLPGQPVALTDRRVRLELNPDGTVRAAMAAPESPKAPDDDPRVRNLLNQ